MTWESSPKLRWPVANPRIRSKKHTVFELTPSEWLNRYYSVGRCDDPLRDLEVVETLRITGAKSRIARYAMVDRNGNGAFLWAWARDTYVVEQFRTFEDARYSAIMDLWRRFEYLEDQYYQARAQPAHSTDSKSTVAA